MLHQKRIFIRERLLTCSSCPSPEQRHFISKAVDTTGTCVHENDYTAGFFVSMRKIQSTIAIEIVRDGCPEYTISSGRKAQS